MYTNRSFIIFNVSELYKIDFNQILESSEDTLRKSVDGTKTFIKWQGEIPTFISELTTKEGPYTYEQIINILNSEEWYQTVELPINQS